MSSYLKQNINFHRNKSSLRACADTHKQKKYIFNSLRESLEEARIKLPCNIYVLHWSFTRRKSLTLNKQELAGEKCIQIEMWELFCSSNLYWKGLMWNLPQQYPLNLRVQWKSNFMLRFKASKFMVY